MLAAQELGGRRERVARMRVKANHELGPQLCAALRDDDVTDVFGNADGSVWLNRLSCGMMRLAIEMQHFARMNLIGTMAGWIGVDVSPEQPFVEGEIWDGTRFSATVPPVVPSPIFAFRKIAKRARALEDYVRSGALQARQAHALRACIIARETILIAGLQGTGKTSLGNAILREIAQHADAARERIAIVEDTIELQVPAHVNHYALRTHPERNITMDELGRRLLRYMASRICVGELRGAEAQSWFEALCTGHSGGFATIHAANVHGALRRFEQLIRKSGAPIDRQEIGAVIDVIVVIERSVGGTFRVSELVRVRSGSAAGYTLEPL